MVSLSNKTLLATALLASVQTAVQGFYLPGVNPHSFTEGQPVKLKVNKLTSVHNDFPIEYYHLPFCQPTEGIKLDHENLGEFLTGDRIENSPYRIEMKTDMYCEQVCEVNLKKEEKLKRKLIKAINDEYHANWIVDNLPSAAKFENEVASFTKYFQGFPIGFKEKDAHFVYNHVNIELDYHEVESSAIGSESEEKEYRIVRFAVEPLSIKHEYNPIAASEDDDGEFAAEITGSTKACKNNSKELHVTYAKALSDAEPQPADGKILFTYDVIWKENAEVSWASRWDIYLSMNDAVPDNIHWFSITNSLCVVFVLSVMLVCILLKNLKNDYDRYSKVFLDEEDQDEGLEDYGWKLVHADVFRAPVYPMTMAVFCGTGMQLLFMAIFTLIFSVAGFLNPSRRGSLVMSLLALYIFMGTIGGYVTAKLYKTYGGKLYQQATFATALGFPGMSFAFLFLMNLLAVSKRSGDAVPFFRMVELLVLWFGVSTPLVFLGAFFGYKVDTIEYPVSTSALPRQIPDQPWFLKRLSTMLFCGVLPFGACYLELFFILSSMWMEQYYYVFGFLFVVFAILLVTIAEGCILLNYVQLCHEDYRWWWSSFLNGGSTSVFVYAYAMFYFKQLESNSVATYILYFGYMGLVSFGLFLICGSVSLFSCLWFNRKIFGSIKID